MNPLRNKAVEQKTLSSPLRMAGRRAVLPAVSAAGNQQFGPGAS